MSLPFNITQVEKAMDNKLVVGSQARILYCNQAGRSRIAAAFNSAVASGALSGPVVSVKKLFCYCVSVVR